VNLNTGPCVYENQTVSKILSRPKGNPGPGPEESKQVINLEVQRGVCIINGLFWSGSLDSLCNISLHFDFWAIPFRSAPTIHHHHHHTTLTFHISRGLWVRAEGQSNFNGGTRSNIKRYSLLKQNRCIFYWKSKF